jgi:hypothetical protein
MPQSKEGQVCQNLSDVEACRELLDRIANSRLFSTCHTLRAFLLYVGENAIAGKLDAIKEQQIGIRVFGRKPDYDPAEDNIVRVRARELRQRLNDYFAGQGRDEPLVVSIPKGHYIPVFELRNPPDAEAPQPDSQPPPPIVREPQVPISRIWMHTLRPHLLESALLLAAAAVVITVLVSKQTANALPDRSTGETNRCLWVQLFPPEQELTVVSADAGFALWQDVSDHNLNLGDYLTRRWFAEDAARDVKMREMAIRRFTSPADLSLAVRISEIARSYNSHVKVKFARNLDIHEVRSGNVVLLGSRRSNPWVELFESRMNFVAEFDRGRGGPAFRNRSPKPGEPRFVALDSRLSVQGPESKLIKSYAVAALLPGSTDHSYVLILEGLSMEGTEAAGEFVTNPKRFGTFLQKIGQRIDKPIKPFEVLLGLNAVAGGYADPEVVAYRYPAF